MTMALVPAQNAWTTDLCDCAAEPSGCGFCLYAFCCQPCAYGTNVELMEPQLVFCGGECAAACCSYYLLYLFTGCPCILHMVARGYIRRKYNIPGDSCADFMITWCCTPCALCQEHRELIIRGHKPGGVAPSVNPQMAPQPQMMVMVPVQIPMPGGVHPGYPVMMQPGYVQQPPPQPMPMAYPQVPKA
ncbi:hypothetical protein Vafri_5192 [Volvox africanus]|uniref:Uncharacterized protein n=1 Tax=Volvox africanus TaxID=51714 RepID=A0A8J4AXZ4_9CHLO|nr:hypothetical protein Vafri_5192 [Volvox africanus]